MSTTIISDKPMDRPRTTVDCLTSTALNQIKDVVEGREPSYHNRGGVGKDIREFGKFALEQVKSVVGGAKGGGASYIETTYRELRIMRDNGQLTKGAFYRITDYTCDVKDVVYLSNEDVAFNCTSAHNDFDLVVLAVAENAVSENAVAVKHRLAEGETDYFANNNLSAWDVKYSLDVDEALQPWALVPYAETTEETIVTFSPIGTTEPLSITAKVLDTDSTDFSGYPIKTVMSDVDYPVAGEQYVYLPSLTIADNVTAIVVFGGQDQEVGINVTSVDTVTHEPQGHGVITFLRDEFGNECHYDFKSIMWRRWLISDAESSFYGLYYDTYDNGGVYKDFYTFSYFDGVGEPLDSSLDAFFYVYFNVLSEFCLNNVFFNVYCASNKFGAYCLSNTLADECECNTLGLGCSGNMFLIVCSSNTFGVSCNDNILGIFCASNKFGDYCSSNILGNNSSHNTFGDYCSSNKFGEENPNNKLEDYVSSINQSEEFRTDKYVRRWFYDQNNAKTSEVLSYTPPLS